PLYPTGGKTSSQEDDGSSTSISLLPPFNYFGKFYSQTYVNHNGHLTFETPWSSFTPEQIPIYGGRDIIAPYWTDLDNRESGNIYYVQYTHGSILQQVTQDINLYFPELNFHANWIFIATWHKVPYYAMPERQNTFQAVLVSNGKYSFVILNYGSLATKNHSVEAGYDTAYSCHHFNILGSFSNNTVPKVTLLSLGSNVNVSGRWAFRVDDDSMDYNGPLYPIGGTTSPRNLNGSSPGIKLLQTFNYFGRSYPQIYVNHNGHLTFDHPWSSHSPKQFPMYGGRDIIAPYWTYLDNRASGNIYYVQYTNGSILQQVTQDINLYFPELNFNASWIFIATWHKVPYYSMPETQTTFQAVLASNGNYSFVLLNYGCIASAQFLMEAGYDTTDSCHHFTIFGSFSKKKLPNRSSNVNVNGRWAFRVDNGSWYCSGPLYQYGRTREDDGNATQILLHTTFNYFNRSYSQIYVNRIGYLTFVAPMSSYSPEQFPVEGGRDTIAPYWADLDKSKSGKFYSVEYTQGSILQQVSQDINLYFPELNFLANWILVATWLKQTAFQAVLASNAEYSFVMLNYGSLASKPVSVEARNNINLFCHHFTIIGSFSDNTIQNRTLLSSRSNVNLPGRWAFRVDNGFMDDNGPLYPVGGNKSSRSDDGSSPKITLLKSFKYFGKSYSQIYVNHNGHLTFEASWSSYSPEQFPIDGGRDIIAPYWTDLDNRESGDIYYVQYTNGCILQQVTQDINLYFPELNFDASWIFIATWHKVPYFSRPETQTTFQAVLASNGNDSFLILNYGCLASKSSSIQAGYDASYSCHHFNIFEPFSINTTQNSSLLGLSSNINVPGRWAFRVSNGSRGCTSNGCISQKPPQFVEGQDATPRHWPWQARLQGIGVQGRSSFCGGSLITDQWVLTAARCIERLRLAEVHLGVNGLSDHAREVIVGIDQYIFHPGYNSTTLENDMCLLKLSSPVRITDYIQPVCLASGNSTFHNGTTSLVTGFGDLGNDILQEVEVQIVGNKKCSCYNQDNINENRICVGLDLGGNNSCQGREAGGPLVVYNGFTWVQGGVVSFRDDCAVPQKLGVFTRVSKYEKWINETVNGWELGFVTFTSSGIDSDLNFTCCTSMPCNSGDNSFGSNENMSRFAQFLALLAVALCFPCL
ncbi:uncharacterized protein LOC119779945, partial [Cyprinodon tularosa]|uniref:uncharacterized protein LOC119779945 n=1 Tax=Cyprinodon tularosa TaxID=77115 RepID=UPI0018E21B7F